MHPDLLMDEIESLLTADREVPAEMVVELMMLLPVTELRNWLAMLLRVAEWQQIILTN